MTPCRTEKVDFSPKKIKQSKTEKPKKQLDRKSHQKKQESNKQKIIKKKLHFPQFLFLFLFLVFLVRVLLSFCFFLVVSLNLVFCFFLGGFALKPYILCAAGVIRVVIDFKSTNPYKSNFEKFMGPTLLTSSCGARAGQSSFQSHQGDFISP